MKKQASIAARSVLCTGKFLSLNMLEYHDRNDRVHHWESASRVNSRGAAVLVPKLMPSGRYLLIRQFRPPMECYVIEFPAGLIDPGETPEMTAVRELYEETGYRGRVTQSLGTGCSSPGMTDESFSTVFMEIDEAAYPQPPAQHLEGTEDIEVFSLAPQDAPAFLDAARRRGDAVDGKLLVFFTALQMSC